jgi:Tol biopolymer transport system component
MLIAAIPATSWATYPGAHGRIAFVGRVGTDTPGGIYTVLPNGSGLQQLTNDSGSERYPSWSADGRRLVYLDATQGALGVFTISAEGGSRTHVIEPNGDLSPPHFSRSGRRIVYARDNLPLTGDGRPRRMAIFTVRADGTEKRRIAGGYAEFPVYSPSGRRIAFDRLNWGNKDGIWTVRRDGSRQHRLTNPGPAFYDKVLDWRPDGRRILFNRCEDSIHSCHGGPWVVRPDGSHEHPVQAVYDATVYSPSGRRYIAGSGEYDSDFESWLCTDIYTISVAGSDRRDVTHNCEDYDNGGPGGFAWGPPSWQPIPQP